MARSASSHRRQRSTSEASGIWRIRRSPCLPCLKRSTAFVTSGPASRSRERGVEHLARGSDEGAPGDLLPVPRLLAVEPAIRLPGRGGFAIQPGDRAGGGEMAARLLPAIALLLWAAAVAAVGAASLWLTEGRLVFAIDDPYIHLAVAESILAGGYGINPGEPASPSSSALYPVLLAATEALGLGPWGPLAIALAAAGASVWLLARLVAAHALPEGRVTLFALGLVLLLPHAAGAVALPFTGMEHSLHILLCLVALAGLLGAVERGRAAWWLLAAVALLPLVRFEGVALAGGVALALAVAGLWRAGLLALLLTLGGLLAYGTAMSAAGLPVLPSSVTMKSTLAAGIGEERGLAETLIDLAKRTRNSLYTREGLILSLAIVALIPALQRVGGGLARRREARLAVALAAAPALAAHIVAAHYGHFHRYEVYALAIAAAGLLVVLGPGLAALQAGRRWAAQGATLAVLAVALLPYLVAAVTIPRAARSIHEQQAQMARFERDFYPAAIAVNDLGLVSYRNDDYVLDLFGLGSEEVRRLKEAGAYDAEAIARLAGEAGIAYAMIYPQWFRGIVPESWCHLATLHSEKVTTAYGTVAFYAARPETVAPLSEALERFRPTLPGRVRLAPSGAPCAEAG